MKKGLFALLIVLVVSCSFVSAITGSIGNARMVLYPEVSGLFGITIEKSILVKNVNDVPINITLEADSNLSKIVNIIDDKFVLQPGEEKKAEFTIKLKKAGNYEGQIFVSFSPEDGKGTGVGLASTIIIRASGSGSQDNNNETESTNSTNVGIIGITSSAISSISSIKPIYIVLLISTLVLLALFLFMLFIIKKKKRRGRSS